MITSLSEQTEILNGAWTAIFDTFPGIERIEHPDPVDDPAYPKECLVVMDTFTISTGKSQSARSDSTTQDVPSYLLEVSVYLPGTRDHPPESDYAEIGTYANFDRLVRALIEAVVSEQLDGYFEGREMDRMCEDIAEQSGCGSEVAQEV